MPKISHWLGAANYVKFIPAKRMTFNSETRIYIIVAITRRSALFINPDVFIVTIHAEEGDIPATTEDILAEEIE